MNFYESARKMIKSQLDSLNAVRAMNQPELDIDSEESKAEIEDILLRDSLSMAIAIMVRLDVMDDTRNDQCQASSRELAKLLAGRLKINLNEKLGVDL